MKKFRESAGWILLKVSVLKPIFSLSYDKDMENAEKVTFNIATGK